MDTTVEMAYRFRWDSEPTDEQLQVIMEEVAEEARHKKAKIAEQIIENIECEYARACSARQTQQT